MHYFRRAGRRWLMVLWLAIFLFSPPVSALTADTYRTLTTPFYDPSGLSESCLGGSFGSGPLYGPRFPAVADTAELASRIENYIKTARSDSPLINHAEDFVTLAQEYDVNPVLVVGMSQMETSLGTAGYGTASGGYNVTNLRPGGEFARYGSYPEGIEAAYKNLAGDLYLGSPSNFTTVAQIINRWAPPSENKTSSYINKVQNILKKVLSEVPTDEIVDVTTASCGESGDGDVVSSEGYAFPVAPQRKNANSNVPAMSPLPCSGNCHHAEDPRGSPAFDISRRPGGDAIVGTPVYAISDGKVDSVSVYRYKGVTYAGCYSINFRSSTDKYWYWYGHLQDPKVQSGQVVKAGQQLAAIGARKCTANGSDSHLHIDRGCVINEVPQKGGREACRDPAFVGLMNRLFEGLPE